MPLPRLVEGLVTRIPYYAFTIRHDRDTGAATEFAKRLVAIRSGAMFPTFTTQSFVSAPRRRGHLLAIGVVETRSLIEKAAQAILDETARFNRTSNAGFQYLGFDDVEAAWFRPEVDGWFNAKTGEQLR